MRFKQLVNLMFYFSALIGLNIMFLSTTFKTLFSAKGLIILDKLFYIVLGFFIASAIIFYRAKLKPR